MNESRRIDVVVSADDYALSPAVSDGIRDLLERGRLSATSCMTASPFWAEQAAKLDSVKGKCDLGVHLTLTDQAPLTAMPILAGAGKLPSPKRLLGLCVTGRLPRVEVRAEIAAQLEAFEATMDQPPNHVDGHHQTHQFPVIRDLIAQVLTERYGTADRKPYIRVCTPLRGTMRRPMLAFQAFGIGWFAPPLKRLATAAGFPVNDGFTGVYDFASDAPYAALFPCFLDNVRDNTVVMCHPGHVDDALRALDPLTDRREEEFRFFSGDIYPDLLARANVRVARFMPTHP